MLKVPSLKRQVVGTGSFPLPRYLVVGKRMDFPADMPREGTQLFFFGVKISRFLTRNFIIFSNTSNDCFSFLSHSKNTSTVSACPNLKSGSQEYVLKLIFHRIPAQGNIALNISPSSFFDFPTYTPKNYQEVFSRER